MSNSRHHQSGSAQFEALESRRLLTGTFINQALPFVLEFGDTRLGIVDRDGHGTGFSAVQVNNYGSQYQPQLMDLAAGGGVLRITTPGNVENNGTNFGEDNRQVNALEMQYNARSKPWTIQTRLRGPFTNFSDTGDQAGIWFGIDQENFVKLALVKTDAGLRLQFIDEQKFKSGYRRQLDGNDIHNVGSFASVNFIDLYIFGDPRYHVLRAFYRINGGALQQIPAYLFLKGDKAEAFFSSQGHAGIFASNEDGNGPITVTFDRFEATRNGPKVNRPNLTTTDPDLYATNVFRDKTITANVLLPNGALDASTVNSSTVRLYDATTGVAVSSAISLSGSTITINPTANLASNRAYILEVTEGIRDLTGKTMIPYITSFTTGTQVEDDDDPPPPPPPPQTPEIQLSDGRLYMSVPVNTGTGHAQEVIVTNTGTATLNLTSIALGGANDNLFRITNSGSLPASLAPGASTTVRVAMNAPSGTSVGIKTATLNIQSNDSDEANVQVSLRGLVTSGKGGSHEPSLQRIMDLYQLPISVGDSTPSTTDLDLLAASDEITVQRLKKAGSGPVTIEVLAAEGVETAPAIEFGYYEPGSGDTRTLVFDIDEAYAQDIAPVVNGSIAFDPGSSPFGLWGNFPNFKNADNSARFVYSEDALNTWEPVPAQMRKVRFYQLKDSGGSVVPNAYVFAFEEATFSPADNQDIVGIIRNVEVAPAGPEIGLQNMDGEPFSNRLVFNKIRDLDPDLPNYVHDLATLRIRNTGTSTLTISSFSITGPWQLVSPPATPVNIAAGGFRDITVRFTATSGRVSLGSLRINSNDADEAQKVVELAGYWQRESENQQEPTLHEVVQMFGYSTVITYSGQQLNGGGLRQAVGDEVLSWYWTRAEADKPVAIRQLAAYHTQGDPAAVGWHRKGSTTKNTVFRHEEADGQTLYPHLKDSSNPAFGTFSPTTAFGFFVDTSWSDDSKNPQEVADNNHGHLMRFYPVRDRNGLFVPNAYLMVMDYQGINYDYNDNVYLVSNIRPEGQPAAPVGFTAVTGNSGTLLDWGDNAEGNLLGYYIYRSTDALANFTRLNDTALTDSEYFDSAITSGKAYYRVFAVTTTSIASPPTSTMTA